MVVVAPLVMVVVAVAVAVLVAVAVAVVAPLLTADDEPAANVLPTTAGDKDESMIPLKRVVQCTVV